MQITHTHTFQSQIFQTHSLSRLITTFEGLPNIPGMTHAAICCCCCCSELISSLSDYFIVLLFFLCLMKWLWFCFSLVITSFRLWNFVNIFVFLSSDDWSCSSPFLSLVTNNQIRTFRRKNYSIESFRTLFSEKFSLSISLRARMKRERKGSSNMFFLTTGLCK